MPARTIALLLNGKLTLLFDNRILMEYEEVLCRRKFGFTRSLISPLLDYIETQGDFVAAEPVRESFTDSDDKMFYEVALTGKARFLITGNKAHFPESTLIVSPKEFIGALTESGETPVPFS